MFSNYTVQSTNEDELESVLHSMKTNQAHCITKITLLTELNKEHFIATNHYEQIIYYIIGIFKTNKQHMDNIYLCSFKQIVTFMNV